MLKIESILVPIDFSERTAAAALHAVALADRFQAKLLFLHVVAPLPDEYAAIWGEAYSGGEWPRTAEVEGYCVDRMRDLAETLAPGHEVETIVLSGDPARAIRKVAQERKIGLVVMPTHSRGPFRRFLLGSNTAKVLHDVECPVLTGAHVEEPARGTPAPYAHLACALHLREESEEVLRWAWEFAQAYKADLSVIHAVPAFRGEASSRRDDFKQSLVNSARRQLHKLLDQTGARAEVFIESGQIHRCLPGIIEREKIDLLVIGRSEETGAGGRLRSDAYALIRAAACPVVSV